MNLESLSLQRMDGNYRWVETTKQNFQPWLFNVENARIVYFL